MGELPHFISGVPEESIAPKNISSAPTEIQRIFNIGFADRSGTSMFFVVPEDSFFLIDYINLSFVNNITPPNQAKAETIILNSDDSLNSIIHQATLDHAEHWVNSVVFTKPPILESNMKLKVSLDAGTNGSRVDWAIMGRVIKNQDRNLI